MPTSNTTRIGSALQSCRGEELHCTSVGAGVYALLAHCSAYLRSALDSTAYLRVCSTHAETQCLAYHSTLALLPTNTSHRDFPCGGFGCTASRSYPPGHTLPMHLEWQSGEQHGVDCPCPIVKPPGFVGRPQPVQPIRLSMERYAALNGCPHEDTDALCPRAIGRPTACHAVASFHQSAPRKASL